eukprot:10745-Heterococcus_DN1.PRE.2
MSATPVSRRSIVNGASAAALTSVAAIALPAASLAADKSAAALTKAKASTCNTANDSRITVLIALLLCASRCVDRSHQVYETDNGVLYIVKKEGKGNRPQKGDYCAVKYTAYLNNGKVFDSTDASKRKPLVFKLGEKQVIPGWEEVVQYMRPGRPCSSHQIIIVNACAEFNIVVPPALAYGAKGVCVEGGECLVPPNETLKQTKAYTGIVEAYSFTV